MSMIGPRFDRNERESFIGVPTRTGRSKHLNLMGRRNRSRFQKSGYVPAKDYRLKQDFLAFGVDWPFECESDQANAVQGSTLNHNAMEANANRS